MILLWAVWISMMIIALVVLLWASYSVFDFVDMELGVDFIGVIAGILTFIVLSPIILFFIVMFGHAAKILG